MAQSHPSLETVPDLLQAHDQWVCWREQTRDEKVTKVPVDPHTGAFASSTDPDTWATVEDAARYADAGDADGLGFVFTDADPFVGVDLDDCRDPETGQADHWAATLIDRLDSYTEVSPSGTGFHVLARGDLPPGRRRHGDVEMYETAHFFTVTGDRVGSQETIETRPDALAAIHEEYVQSDDEQEHTGTSGQVAESDQRDAVERSAHGGVDLDDETLLERAQDAANGEKFTRLWQGETSGYDSHSEADMALCSLLAFWTGGDPDRMDRLFRQSGLVRDKWDERHYADGTTYGEKTVQRAIAGVDEFYDPSPATETAAGRATGDDHGRRAVRNAAVGRLGRVQTEPRSNGEIESDVAQSASREVNADSSPPSVSALTARIETLEMEVRRLKAELERERDHRETLERRLDASSHDGDHDGTATQTNEAVSGSVWERARGLLAKDADDSG